MQMQNKTLFHLILSPLVSLMEDMICRLTKCGINVKKIDSDALSGVCKEYKERPSNMQFCITSTNIPSVSSKTFFFKVISLGRTSYYAAQRFSTGKTKGK